MFLGASGVDWIGYLAMVLVASAFTMKNMFMLRFLNTAGALVFIAYGILIDMAWPVILTNSFILIFNLYYLLYKKSEV